MANLFETVTALNISLDASAANRKLSEANAQIAAQYQLALQEASERKRQEYLRSAPFSAKESISALEDVKNDMHPVIYFFELRKISSCLEKFSQEMFSDIADKEFLSSTMRYLSNMWDDLESVFPVESQEKLERLAALDSVALPKLKRLHVLSTVINTLTNKSLKYWYNGNHLINTAVFAIPFPILWVVIHAAGLVSGLGNAANASIMMSMVIMPIIIMFVFSLRKKSKSISEVKESLVKSGFYEDEITAFFEDSRISSKSYRVTGAIRQLVADIGGAGVACDFCSKQSGICDTSEIKKTLETVETEVEQLKDELYGP